MRVHLAVLIVSGAPFASTDAVLHIGEPDSLRINNGDGPVRRRLQPDPSGGETRNGIPAEIAVHFIEHAALTTLGMIKKSASSLAWPRRIADSDIPLDYKRIVYEYALTYKIKGLQSMESLTKTYGDIKVAETINALKSTNDKFILDFAAGMQRKQVWVWQKAQLSPDGLFKLLKLDEQFPKEDVQTSLSARLASLFNDPTFASWKAYVHHFNKVDPVSTMIKTLNKHYGDDKLVERLSKVEGVGHSKDVAMKLGKVQNLLAKMNQKENPKEYAFWEFERDFYVLYLMLFQDAKSKTRRDVFK